MLIDQLIADGYLKTPRIIKAFRHMDRAHFLPERVQASAEVNAPVPIGFGQTNSQPLTVAFMLELLQPKPGDRALDIGSGSGWVTALLADIVGPKGTVDAVERIAELVGFGQERVRHFDLSNIRFHQADGSLGYAAKAPYDVIHVAAASSDVPDALLEQLAPDGRCIIPVGPPGEQSLVLMMKQSSGKITRQEYPGFTFVPLIKAT